MVCIISSLVTSRVYNKGKVLDGCGGGINVQGGNVFKIKKHQYAKRVMEKF